jgi:mono/diheme cytochrome c family protein
MGRIMDLSRITLATMCGLAIPLVASLLLCSAAGADARRGFALSQRWCSGCHAVRSAQASPNPAAPTFREIANEASVTDYSLRVFLRTPHPTMPNFILDADDLDDITNYILSLKLRY